MCGIAAIFMLHGRPAEASALRRMATVIRHRGPDDEGSYLEGHVGLAFRRLSILDLSANGHQPMTTPDGRYTIVFNGEIYNYIELRRELAGLGHVFRSSGDSEVLLHAYQEWGHECLPKLNGMWAFLIFDKVTGTLFGSRDRFGIKPLYLARDESAWLFGSELKCIRASGRYREAINWNVAARYLVEGKLDDSDQTFFDGITKLPQGCWFTLERDGTYREHRFWTPGVAIEEDSPALFARFGQLFEDAVALHSRSDVPLAVHLSGGLDSTSILCALARLRERSNPGQTLQALSYMAPEFDERSYIADTLRQTGAQVMRLSTTPTQLWDTLGEVLWHHDEPVHSMTALVSYALMRETARHGIKVVLNGQGADETLAGYPSYFGNLFHELLATGRFRAALAEMRAYARSHGVAFPGLALRQLLFLVRGKLGRIEAYRRVSIGRRNRALEQEGSWFSRDLRRPLQDEAYVTYDLTLREALLRSISEAPLPLYLRIEDRNSMAWSIESRVPFLDWRLVDLALSAEARALLGGGYNKRLLRGAMEGRIPESVRLRVDKMGFPTPAKTWLAGELVDSVTELVHSKLLADAGIVDMRAVDASIGQFRRGEVDCSAALFRLAQFGLWMGLETPSARRAPQAA